MNLAFPQTRSCVKASCCNDCDCDGGSRRPACSNPLHNGKLWQEVCAQGRPGDATNASLTMSSCAGRTHGVPRSIPSWTTRCGRHTCHPGGTHGGSVAVRLGCGRIKPEQLGHDDGAERRQVVLNRVPHQALVDHVIGMPVEIAYRHDARPIDGRMPGFEGLWETT